MMAHLFALSPLILEKIDPTARPLCLHISQLTLFLTVLAFVAQESPEVKAT